MRSEKHPGYEITKDSYGYLMEHDTYNRYAISVWLQNGEYIAELLTWQAPPEGMVFYNGRDNNWEWGAPKNKDSQFCGTVEEVKLELERRGKYWALKNKR